METESRVEQAARCMNCGMSFCQAGAVFGGMVSGCPLNNLIPEWNDEIYRGNWMHALSRLRKTNNFPEFTGRVCPALCEAACTCGLDDLPVTVHDNELAIIEEAFANGWIKPRIPAVRSGKKVAIIGSGPSGLAVADQLNQRGHSVVVFERDLRPGGLLMYGIPNMKLGKHVVERRISLMEAEGIEFKTGINVGEDLGAQELVEQFDAVILCCGSKTPRDLSVSERDCAQVHFAVDFLSDATRKVTGELDVLTYSAQGKDVVIVGGGDTGNDCVGTCIRQGCKSVTQLEMMKMLPQSRGQGNPWPQWPRISKIDYGQEEAIAVFGRDPRVYETTVKELIKNKKGQLTAVKTVKLSTARDEETGRMVMREVEGSEREIPCDLLLIAAGFVGCEAYIAKAFGVGKDARGNLVTKTDGYATHIQKVFAAGDARRGQVSCRVGNRRGQGVRERSGRISDGI